MIAVTAILISESDPYTAVFSLRTPILAFASGSFRYQETTDSIPKQIDIWIAAILVAVVVVLFSMVVYLLLALKRARSVKVPITPAFPSPESRSEEESQPFEAGDSAPEMREDGVEEEEEEILLGRLMVVRGLEENQIPILCETFTIGRSAQIEDCDYGIDKPFISPKHCTLLHHGGNFRIKDLGSKNGTFVNGERLPREREIIVPIGSEIAITKNIVLELWDADTVLEDIERKDSAYEQEYNSAREEKFTFQAIPGIAYADDDGGEIRDDYSPI